MKTIQTQKPKKTRVRKLTLNQKRVLDRIEEQVTKGNKVVVSKAMQGIYAPSLRTTKITKLPEYEALLERHLSDSKLAKKHDQLLNATSLEKLYFDEVDSDETIQSVISQMEGYKLLHIITKVNDVGAVTSKQAFVKAPDNNTQDKALDKAYKIRGRYPKEGSNVALQFNFGQQPNYEQ